MVLFYEVRLNSKRMSARGELIKGNSKTIWVRIGNRIIKRKKSRDVIREVR